jgi:hypothetical protein
LKSSFYVCLIPIEKHEDALYCSFIYILPIDVTKRVNINYRLKKVYREKETASRETARATVEHLLLKKVHTSPPFFLGGVPNACSRCRFMGRKRTDLPAQLTPYILPPADIPSTKAQQMSGDEYFHQIFLVDGLFVVCHSAGRRFICSSGGTFCISS